MPPTKSRKTYQGFEEKWFHLNYNDTEFDVLVWWYNLDSQYVIKSVVSCNLEDCKFDKFPFSKSAWVKRGIARAISRQKEEEKKPVRKPNRKLKGVLREEFIDVTDISLTHKESYVIYEDEKEKFVFELSSVHIDIGIDMSSFTGLMKSIGDESYTDQDDSVQDYKMWSEES